MKIEEPLLPEDILYLKHTVSKHYKESRSSDFKISQECFDEKDPLVKLALNYVRAYGLIFFCYTKLIYPFRKSEEEKTYKDRYKEANIPIIKQKLKNIIDECNRIVNIELVSRYLTMFYGNNKFEKELALLKLKEIFEKEDSFDAVRYLINLANQIVYEREKVYPRRTPLEVGMGVEEIEREEEIESSPFAEGIEIEPLAEEMMEEEEELE
jgi:hypothetical protein